MYMRIQVYNSKKTIQYDLDIKNRLTILKGNSASGKSILTKMIDAHSVDKSIIIISDMPVRHLTYTTLELNPDLSSDVVYILDEYDGVDTKLVAKYINNRNYKFILITRYEINPLINYSTDDIYELYKSGKIIKNRKLYAHINDNSNIKLDKINKFITEDSGSGKEFFENLQNITVTSTNGNGNITKDIVDNSIIFFDRVSFGPYIRKLSELILYKNIGIICPQLFEHLLLTSELFNTGKIQAEYEKINSECLRLYPNTTLESIYYRLLVNITSELNIKYSKSDIDSWFFESKQYNKIIEGINKKYNIDLFKLNNSTKENNVRSSFSWE